MYLQQIDVSLQLQYASNLKYCLTCKYDSKMMQSFAVCTYKLENKCCLHFYVNLSTSNVLNNCIKFDSKWGRTLIANLYETVATSCYQVAFKLLTFGYWGMCSNIPLCVLREYRQSLASWRKLRGNTFVVFCRSACALERSSCGFCPWYYTFICSTWLLFFCHFSRFGCAWIYIILLRLFVSV